jgi:hypothetical protein
LGLGGLVLLWKSKCRGGAELAILAQKTGELIQKDSVVHH